MPVSNLQINHINTQRVGIAFTVTGSFSLNPPNGLVLNYADNGKAAVAAKATVTYRATKFSFVHPGIARIGEHRIAVAAVGSTDTARSNWFAVVHATRYRWVLQRDSSRA